MIKDIHGEKISPRQKASDVLLSRLGHHAPMDDMAREGLTEREQLLVNRQIEKMHAKMNKMLMKARGDSSDAEQE